MTDDAIFRPEVQWRRGVVRCDGPQSERDRALGTLEDLFLRCGFPSRRDGENVVHDFARLVRLARSPVEVRRGLVRLAWRLTGARRVDLLLQDPVHQHVRRAACWPEPSLVRARDTPPDASTLTLVTDPEGTHVPRAELSPPCAASLRLPLSWQHQILGTLVIFGGPDRDHCPRSRLHRLETLCDMAAAAERAWEATTLAAEVAPPLHDRLTGLHHAAFLDTFLAHALAQARRRREGLSLLILGADRLEGVRREQGHAIADAILQRVARAVVESLRVSDVVARLDRNRLAAVLPAAVADDAVRAARHVVDVVAEAGLTAPTHPPMTASVGIAGYPDHADTPADLRKVASAALALAQARGAGQIGLLSPRRF